MRRLDENGLGETEVILTAGETSLDSIPVSETLLHNIGFIKLLPFVYSEEH